MNHLMMKPTKCKVQFSVNHSYFRHDTKTVKIVLLYDTVSLFLVLLKVFSYKSDVGTFTSKIISAIYFPNFWKSYEIAKILHFYPYMPSVHFVGHRQTVQTQIIHHIMRHLIRVSTVCLHHFLFFKNLNKNEKNTT